MHLHRGHKTRRRTAASILSASTLVAFVSCISRVCAQLSSSDYFVHDLPGAPPGPLLKMHAGHIEITPEHHGNLFFWHYQNRHIGDRQRTVIWLNGGPGCSSLDGALMEVGPYRVKQGGTLQYNPGSWDEFANLLFVDNPVGTGFSFVDTDSYLHELQEMADNFIIFLEKWFTIFPEYEHDDLYLSGESYAGQHIPYIARAILDRNADRTKRPWSLKGLLIGNGWTSPKDQYPAYLQYAYKRGLIKQGSAVGKEIEAQQAICNGKLAQASQEHVDIPECEMILQEILRKTVDSSAPADQRCINMYDVRLRDSYSSCGMNWPPDLKDVTPYLRRQDVLTALHVSPDKRTGWTECSGAVSGAFRAYNSQPAIHLLPGILETVPVVLFSGAEDLICNHVGTEEMIHNMAWNGGTGFELEPGTWAPRQDWTFEGNRAGIYQEARNLTYVLFYNASHMVPFDFPRRTRDMLDRFMGVDIGSIGGTPGDSRLDGAKGPETSVGGTPNSTLAESEEASKLKQATYNAYYRSGEVALVFVIIAAGLWFWYIWRDRSRRLGYTGVGGKRRGSVGVMMDGMRDVVSGGVRLESFRHKSATGHYGNGGASPRRGDLEAADFDEAELDRIDAKGRVRRERSIQRERERERERVLQREREREGQRLNDDRDADMQAERYDIGSDSDEGADVGLANGRGGAR